MSLHCVKKIVQLLADKSATRNKNTPTDTYIVAGGKAGKNIIDMYNTDDMEMQEGREGGGAAER
jgi:hypothetical protein